MQRKKKLQRRKFSPFFQIIKQTNKYERERIKQINLIKINNYLIKKKIFKKNKNQTNKKQELM